MAKMKPIRTEADYDAALARIHQIWGAKPGSPDGDELDALLTLVEAYEDGHYPMDSPSPAAAIEFRMDQEGLTPDDLPDLGTPAEIKEVLAGERPLTPKMAHALHERFGIPYDVLLQEQPLAPVAAGGANPAPSPVVPA